MQQGDNMKLQDINATVFQTLTPEVQNKLIEAQQNSDSMDPFIVLSFVALMMIPMVLMR